jgi:hypothetical protein
MLVPLHVGCPHALDLVVKPEYDTHATPFFQHVHEAVEMPPIEADFTAD